MGLGPSFKKKVGTWRIHVWEKGDSFSDASEAFGCLCRLRKGRSPGGPDPSHPRDTNGQSDQSHSENDTTAAVVRPHNPSDVVMDSDEQPSEIEKGQRSVVVAASPEDGETGEGIRKAAADSKDGSDAEEGEVEA